MEEEKTYTLTEKQWLEFKATLEEIKHVCDLQVGIKVDQVKICDSQKATSKRLEKLSEIITLSSNWKGLLKFGLYILVASAIGVCIGNWIVWLIS